MAGDWIKLENVTPDKPEVIAIADILGIDQDAVLGKLVRLWIWADEQTFDGNAGGNGVSVTNTFINRRVFLNGFAEAMEKVDWITSNSDGSVTFPNFNRHNGETAKKRALTAKRVAKHRLKKTSKAKKSRNAKRNATCNGVSVTQVLPEKRREEYIDSSYEESGAAPQKEPAPTAFRFAAKGKTWTLPQAKYDEYRASYAGRLTAADLDAEFTKARQWLTDNPNRRPTTTGMPQFLTRWLNRAYDDRAGLRLRNQSTHPAVDDVPEFAN